MPKNLILSILLLLAGGMTLHLGSIHQDHRMVLAGGFLMIVGAVGCGMEGNRHAQKK